MSSLIDGPISSKKWWVGLQAGFGLGGGGVWIAGEVAGNEFVAGAGLGLVVAALILRFGRRAAAKENE